jgi:NSS family neurotransmitter:Na+ symporter
VTTFYEFIKLKCKKYGTVYKKKMDKKAHHRGQWNSRIGFILAASGSAVGLGAVWRFPYITGQSGGAAFVLLYLGFLIIIAIPYMFCEFALGRSTKKNPIGAVRQIRPKSFWITGGVLSVLVPVLICSYYAVIGSWALGYIFKMFVNQATQFKEFVAAPQTMIPLFAVFLILNVLIVYKGIEKGIERWAKVLMPMLFILMLVLLVRSVTLQGAAKGLQFYLEPDFSKINGAVVLAALGQASFSLSLGMGVMITYASYLSDDEDMVSSGAYVALFTTLIALVMGMIVFSALFAFKENPACGPALVFIILPELFSKMFLGNILGSAFFLLISVAAFTTIISFLEVAVAYLIDDAHKKRKYAVWVAAALIFILGIPSLLSEGASARLSSLSFFGGKSFLDMMDFTSGTIGILLSSLALCLFVGWGWGADKAVEELQRGSVFFQRRFLGLPIKTARVWQFFIRYICPLAIIAVLLDALHIL